jgi:hypothetical protein
MKVFTVRLHGVDGEDIIVTGFYSSRDLAEKAARRAISALAFIDTSPEFSIKESELIEHGDPRWKALAARVMRLALRRAGVVGRRRTLFARARG